MRENILIGLAVLILATMWIQIANTNTKSRYDVVTGSNMITITGNDTRPTTDRIKETLFNILQPEIPGCRFLDLFSGSGAIGIEALSRGADYAVFVEKNQTYLDAGKK